MSKEKKLSLIKEYMVKADLPLKKGATRLVFGEGSPDAKVLFLGEAPGYWEDIKGVPFVGNAGTAMRFLPTYIATGQGKVTLTGIERIFYADEMRPKITWLCSSRFPPLA